VNKIEKVKPISEKSQVADEKPKTESYAAMMKRLNADWEAKQHEKELRTVLEEWACNPALCLSDTVQKRLGYTAAMMFRLMKSRPELRAVYEEGMYARWNIAKSLMFEAAVGARELSVGQSIMCGKIVHGYDPDLIRRAEITGDKGGPMLVRFETAESNGECPPS